MDLDSSDRDIFEHPLQTLGPRLVVPFGPDTGLGPAGPSAVAWRIEWSGSGPATFERLLAVVGAERVAALVIAVPADEGDPLPPGLAATPPEATAVLLAAAGRLVDLQGLFLYDIESWENTAPRRLRPPALDIPVDVGALLRAYPRLRTLGVCGRLDLPPTSHERLSHLWVHTDAPAGDTLDAIGACALPSLRRLELNLVDHGDPTDAERARRTARTVLPDVRTDVTVVTSRLDVFAETMVEDMVDAAAFAERWHRAIGEPLRPGDGFAEADLAAAERRLGVALPAAVRSAYLRSGRRYGSGPDRLLGPDALRVDAGMLVFRTGRLGEWAVPADAAAADPPVSLRDAGAAGWRTSVGSFSELWVELVLGASVDADGPLTDACRPAAAALDRIRAVLAGL